MRYIFLLFLLISCGSQKVGPDLNSLIQAELYQSSSVDINQKLFHTKLTPQGLWHPIIEFDHYCMIYLHPSQKVLGEIRWVRKEKACLTNLNNPIYKLKKISSLQLSMDEDPSFHIKYFANKEIQDLKIELKNMRWKNPFAKDLFSRELFGELYLESIRVGQLKIEHTPFKNGDICHDVESDCSSKKGDKCHLCPETWIEVVGQKCSKLSRKYCASSSSCGQHGEPACDSGAFARTKDICQGQGRHASCLATLLAYCRTDEVWCK